MNEPRAPRYGVVGKSGMLWKSTVSTDRITTLSKIVEQLHTDWADLEQAGFRIVELP